MRMLRPKEEDTRSKTGWRRRCPRITTRHLDILKYAQGDKRRYLKSYSPVCIWIFSAYLRVSHTFVSIFSFFLLRLSHTLRHNVHQRFRPLHNLPKASRAWPGKPTPYCQRSDTRYLCYPLLVCAVKQIPDPPILDLITHWGRLQQLQQQPVSPLSCLREGRVAVTKASRMLKVRQALGGGPYLQRNGVSGEARV